MGKKIALLSPVSASPCRRIVSLVREVQTDKIAKLAGQARKKLPKSTEK
jgi:hypothetical protein